MLSDALMALTLVGPAALFRVGTESFDVGELVLQGGHELGCGDEVVTLLADVGVGAGCVCRRPRPASSTSTRAFDFLGFRIRRDHKEGDGRAFVYTYPAQKALASIKRKVRTITRQGTHHPLSHLLRQLRLVLRGWCNYFRHGVSSRTFGYLAHLDQGRVLAAAQTPQGELEAVATPLSQRLPGVVAHRRERGAV